MGLFGSDLPTIIVGEADHHDLLVVTMGGSGHDADAADDLLFELGRARVVPNDAVPPQTVQMGSEVFYSFDNDPIVKARLVFPAEVTQDPDCVSVLSPIGTALLGLAEGESMRWTTREGRRHLLRIHRVHNPQDRNETAIRPKETGPIHAPESLRGAPTGQRQTGEVGA